MISREVITWRGEAVLRTSSYCEHYLVGVEVKKDTMSPANCFVSNQGRTHRGIVCDILRVALLLSAYKCNRPRKTLETIHTADKWGSISILTSYARGKFERLRATLKTPIFSKSSENYVNSDSPTKTIHCRVSVAEKVE